MFPKLESGFGNFNLTKNESFLLANAGNLGFMHIIDRLAGHAMSILTRSSALVSGAFDFPEHVLVF